VSAIRRDLCGVARLCLRLRFIAIAVFYNLKAIWDLSPLLCRNVRNVLQHGNGGVSHARYRVRTELRAMPVSERLNSVYQGVVCRLSQCGVILASDLPLPNGNMFGRQMVVQLHELVA
jgi:hypothetical protein